jgi:osmotically-inducible protein OsmY
MKNFAFRRLALSVTAGCVLLGSVTACVPLIVGGAVAGGSLVATDRRTSGAQLEDEGIELRALSVNLTSYNRQVLLTGEAANAQDKQLIEQIVSRVENVNSIINELAIMGNATLTQRSSDALVTGRVRATLVDTRDLYANAFKVVTERGTTYLMGRVTQREADRATEVVRSVSGVQKVVRIFEIISEQELARMLPSPAVPSTPAAIKP